VVHESQNILLKLILTTMSIKKVLSDFHHMLASFAAGRE
jgi:hypothetical protein